MLRSMTGYGKAEKEFANRNVSVEIKSVNHRYCDISVRTSRKYSFLEEHIKSKVRKKVRRGKIEIGLTLESCKEPDFDVKINDSLLKEYIENFKYIEDEFAIQSDVSISDVLSMPEVIIVSAKPENESEILMQVGECLEEAVEKFNQMREKEGASMERDILNRKKIVAGHLNKMKRKVENSQETYMKMLRERIGELLKDTVEIPEEKVLTEAAFLADKANITEEIVRMESHLIQLEDIVNGEEIQGRKLDFLIQEINRETNTIGSKVSNLDITKGVIEIKSEIEKIREQIQNVE